MEKIAEKSKTVVSSIVFKNREAVIEALFSQASEAMTTIHPPLWKFSSCNPAALQLFGVKSEEDFIQLRPCELSPHYQPDGMLSSEKSDFFIKKALEEGSCFFPWDHQTQNGEILHCTVRLSRIIVDGQAFLFSVIRDISDLSVMKSALDCLITSLDDMVFEIDENCCFVNAWTHDTSKFFVPRDEFIGRKFDEYLGGEVSSKLREAMLQTNINRIPVRFEYKDILANPNDENPTWYRAKVSKQEGSIIQPKYTVVISDVTREKTANKQTEEAQKELEKFFDVSIELFCIAGVDGRFRKLNSNWEDVLGYTCEELTSRPFLDFVHPDDLHATQREISKLSLGIPTIAFENRYRCKDGSYRLLSWATSPDVRTGALYASARDITAFREAERLLRIERAHALQNAKMASLGEMAAGIAHEINNPLAIISGHLYTLPHVRGNDEGFAEKIQAISRSTERIAKIVNGLRKFSRTSVATDRKAYDISGIIQESVGMTRAQMRRAGVEVKIYCEPHLYSMCNEIEIGQVFINLINNSIDAIKNNSEKWIEITAWSEEDLIRVRVKDSGKGILPDASDRLFQPFFTTKPVGEGTGLGLAIVRGILTDHKASIRVIEDMENTCFELQFLKFS